MSNNPPWGTSEIEGERESLLSMVRHDQGRCGVTQFIKWFRECLLFIALLWTGFRTYASARYRREGTTSEEDTSFKYGAVNVYDVKPSPKPAGGNCCQIHRSVFGWMRSILKS